MRTTILGLIAAVFLTPQAHGQWQQWGGPERDFAVESEVELDVWGELGPKVLWLRPFGPGYAGLVLEGDLLFTMTRNGVDEVIVALSAADGAERWRHAYAAPTDPLSSVDRSYGDAPQATPLVAEGRVYGFGFTGVLSAVDATSGEPAWSRDLSREHGAAIPYFGHAASPLRVGDTVVVLAGGAHAFDLQSGELRWSNRDFAASYASPILVQGPTGEQLVAAAAGEVVGLSPVDGRLLWRHEHANQHRTILSTPVVGKDGTLFASAYFLGSIGLRFQDDGRPRELWSNDVQISKSNAVALGGMVVASHDRNLKAIDLQSGETLWRERGMKRSNLVRVGRRALLLNERGLLTLAELGRDGMKTLAAAKILEGRSWTAPTVSGRRLFARNGTEIVAVDLGISARDASETAAGRRQLEDRGPTDAPRAFVHAVARLEGAARSSDAAALAKALDDLEPYATSPSLAPYVQYYQGFAAWQRSLEATREERLELVDRAVEALKRAVESEDRFAEAHALLAATYPSYWRLAPARAAVIGPLGDEHLDKALELDPENPRTATIQALDLLNSPAQYGGDPKRGKALLEEAVRHFDREKRRATDPGPRWGPALARLWLAERLLREGDGERARRLLEEALQLDPDFDRARRLLASQDMKRSKP